MEIEQKKTVRELTVKKGYDSFQNGSGEEWNPYPRGSDMYQWWNDGWIEAFTEQLP